MNQVTRHKKSTIFVSLSDKKVKNIDKTEHTRLSLITFNCISIWISICLLKLFICELWVRLFFHLFHDDRIFFVTSDIAVRNSIQQNNHHHYVWMCFFSSNFCDEQIHKIQKYQRLDNAFEFGVIVNKTGFKENKIPIKYKSFPVSGILRIDWWIGKFRKLSNIRWIVSALNSFKDQNHSQ